MSTEADFIEICRVPHSIARLGTLARLGTSLGWGLDQLAVKHEAFCTVLLRHKAAEAHRPPVSVLAAPPRLITLAAEDPQAQDEEGSAPPDPEPPAAPESTPEPAPEPPVAPPSDELPDHHPDSLYQRTCQKCGKVFSTRNGRLIHNGRQHGDNPDYAAIAKEIDAQREEPATRPRSRVEKRLPVKSDTNGRGPHPLLRCEEPACGFTTEFAVDMNSHTRGAHQRPATRQERIPVLDGEAQ